MQTKLYVSETKSFSSIPVTAQGPKPPIFQNVNMGAAAAEAEGTGLNGEQKPQSFLFKYVSSNFDKI